MPIKPQNRGRYPREWKAIRASILARAGNCCEKCGVPNRVFVVRGTGLRGAVYQLPDGAIHCAASGNPLPEPAAFQAEKTVEIVLTIAHLDHQPENNDPENLRAWCQKCHLNYDSSLHVENRRRSRIASPAE